ncbi:hypothetical protein CYY_004582 [Polysphondylium violaceum]|uniref:Peptidase S28 family protein n=1 Tax=Polysphondylium violaceum TaxID=133409 RepID=A0A8J4PWC0_9MYCE|nr:hypothetical protein CYY_004582 [Polysphondylium violaceum]
MKYIILSLFLTILVTNAVRLGHDSALNKGLKYYRGVDKLSASSVSDPSPMWYTQQVDHFDPSNSDTFQQQYYVNSTYYAPGGPIFLVLGGEGPLTAGYVTGHFVVNLYAQKFNALIVAVEHRFYGKSMPKPDLSTENLKFLTTQQALADYATFRQYIAQKYNTGNGKWISFGGSYSGSLSAWMRLKYPHLIDGAIATSAPVLPQLDFPEYFEVVSTSVGPTCSAVIANVTATVTQMLANDRASVQSIFNACDPIVTDLDVATFMESLSGGVAETVQYNNDNNKYTMSNITTMCAQLEQGDPLQAFASFNNRYNTFSGANCTTSSYNSMIQSMQDVDPNGDNAASRSWTWQTCIEYGYFQVGESPNQPFSSTITLDYFLQQCTDIFGPPGYQYQPAIDWIIADYGATDYQGSNVILPNGLVDPWHILGVLQTTNPNIQISIIPEGAHCSDLYPPKPNDPASLIATRQKEVALISSIIYSK